MADLSPRVILPDCFDIQQAAWAHRALLDSLHEHSQLDLDGREVRRTDAAAMQVLAAAALEARRRGAPFSLSPSPAITEAARVLGLDAVLALDAPKA